VCVGPALHAALAIEVMEAGYPVYTEKPPALRAADAREVLEVSRRRGQICMTGFKKRFAPVYRAARAAVEDSGFGGASLLAIDYASGAYRNDPADPASHFLLDFGIHVIDLARYLLGEVDEVSARRRDYDTYAVTLTFASGALGVLALSGRRSWGISTEKVELTGGHGQFLSVENSTELTRFSADSVVERRRPVFATMAGDSLVETGFQPELEVFVEAVRTGTEPESSIASSYETMRLYEAIVASADSRGTIPLATP
jgi:predicted dehydrogenase